MICIKKIFTNASTSSNETTKLVELFFSKNSTQKRYLLGKNKSAKQAIQTFSDIKFDGIIDDFDNQTSWENLPIVRSNSIEKSSTVINCSSSIRPISAHQHLLNLGISVLKYSDLCTHVENLPPHDFVTEFRNEIQDHESFWIGLGNRLEDEISKTTLSNIMQFRLTGDYSYMGEYTVRFNEQYFDPIIQISNDEVFVDCGGFDGDTTLEFIKRYQNYSKIFIFEPSQINFIKANKNLDGLKNIRLLPLGVSDKQGTLFFDPNNGSACSISTSGSTKIEVVTIDEVIQDKISFIKMDLEGWELKALQGAENHIRENHPKLAISIYHSASDFRKVPEYILSIRNDYKIYLRHYSEGWSETVMYFIPA